MKNFAKFNINTGGLLVLLEKIDNDKLIIQLLNSKTCMKYLVFRL